MTQKYAVSVSQLKSLQNNSEIQTDRKKETLKTAQTQKFMEPHYVNILE